MYNKAKSVLNQLKAHGSLDTENAILYLEAHLKDAESIGMRKAVTFFKTSDKTPKDIKRVLEILKKEVLEAAKIGEIKWNLNTYFTRL